MRPSDSHPFVAFSVDLLLLGAVLTFAESLLPFGVRDPANVISMVVALVLSLAIPAIYHSSFARRTLFLTPGELATGGWIIDGEKRWMNPYSISRVNLFVVFVALLFFNAPADPLTHAAASLFVTLMLGGCIVAVGRGYAWGLLGPIVYRAALVAGEIATGSERSPLLLFAVHGLDIVLLLIAVLVLLRYVTASKPLRLAEAA